MRVLITGGSGFIGRWVCRSLVSDGHEVTASASSGRLVDGAHRTVELDLLDPCATRRVVRAVRPEALVHLAWIATPGVYWMSPLNISWVRATLGLLEDFADSGGRRAVLAGTCAEYEWGGLTPLQEDCSPLRNVLSAECPPYPLSKILLSRLLDDFGKSSGLSVAWGRVFHLYGPNERDGRLFSSIVNSIRAGQHAHCSDGSQVRGYLHVHDVATAFCALVRSPIEGAVNIGSDEEVTVATFSKMVADELGRRDLLLLGARPARLDDPAYIVANIGKLRREVGWTPRHDLQSGVRDAIQSWRQV